MASLPDATKAETLLTRTVRQLEGMGGHMYGDYVVHSLLRSDPGWAHTIVCTLPPSTLRYAAMILTGSGMTLTGGPPSLSSTTYGADRGDEDRHRWEDYRVRDGDSELVLRLAPFMKSHGLAAADLSMFDKDLFVASQNQIYLQRRAFQRGSPLEHVGDRLARLIDRVRRGVFCVSHMAPPVGTTSSEDGSVSSIDSAHVMTHATAMRRALRLVKEGGWRMDDWLTGRGGWVLERWDDLKMARGPVHGSGNVAATHPHAHVQCPICHERFAADDIVVNLPCNHNFHAECHRDGGCSSSSSSNRNNGGLCTWLASGNGTCPCCRALVMSTRTR